MNHQAKSRLRHVLDLVGVYLAACLFYAWFVRRFTIPVHLGVDEELYISMARSFHYEGAFQMNGETLNYSCCLYSMLLSLAYFFYNPATLLYHFRLIGVVCMLSAVFPAYLLAERLLNSRKMIWLVVLAAVLTPSMADTAYCMQETLAYPIALWFFYLILRDCEEHDKTAGYSLAIGAVSVAAYFVKTYLLVLPAAYLLFQLMRCRRSGRRKSFVRCLICGVVFLAGVLAGHTAVLQINDGVQGSNHYASQFSNLFEIGIRVIPSVLSCLIFYVVCLLFYFWVLPVLAVFRGRRQEDDRTRAFTGFLFMTGILLVVEIVVTIVVTEESGPLLPHKFLYRYFQILEIPLLSLFLRQLEKRHAVLYRRDLLAVWGVCGYLALYFYFRGPSMHTAVIDAPLFLLLENATRYGSRFAGSAACVLVGILISLVYFRSLRPERKESVIQRIPALLFVYLCAFLCLNMIQLPYYCNVVADGSAIEKDAVAAAGLLNDRGISTVYYLVGDTDRYEQAVYAYQKAKTIAVTEDELTGMDHSGNIVITAAKTAVPYNFQSIDLSLQTLRVYQVR